MEGGVREGFIKGRLDGRRDVSFFLFVEELLVLM